MLCKRGGRFQSEVNDIKKERGVSSEMIKTLQQFNQEFLLENLSKDSAITSTIPANTPVDSMRTIQEDSAAAHIDTSRTVQEGSIVTPLDSNRAVPKGSAATPLNNNRTIREDSAVVLVDSNRAVPKDSTAAHIDTSGTVREDSTAIPLDSSRTIREDSAAAHIDTSRTVQEDNAATPLNSNRTIRKKNTAVRMKSSGLPVLKEFLFLLLKITSIALIFILTFTFLFGLIRYKDPSMDPAIKDGDLVVFYRYTKSGYQPRDAVILDIDGQRQVRRVVATEGDVVDITDGGLVINNALQQETDIYQRTERYEEGIGFPMTVPKGHVFVLSDSRIGATDSRIYGSVRIEDTLGKVMTVIRRRSI